MTIAVLGSHPTGREVAAALRGLGFSVQTAQNGETTTSSMTSGGEERADSIVESGNSMGLLGNSDIEGVLFGGSSAEEKLIARRLVGAGIPLLVIPDARQTSSFVYEMIPLVEEAGRRVIPAFPMRSQPTVIELKHRLQAGELGTLRVLRLTRTIAGDSSGLPVGKVDDAFLQDVDLMRMLGGEFKKVTAVRIGVSQIPNDETVVAETSVILATEGGVEGVWRTVSGAGASWEMEIVCDKGRAMLRSTAGNSDPIAADSANRNRGAEGEHWQLEIKGTEVSCVGESSIAAVARDFARVLTANGEESTIATAANSPETGDHSNGVGWTDLVRAFDLLDALHRSLRRQRTIVLQFEETSERNQFKTQMTAIGCGVIVWAAFGLVIGLGIAKSLDPRDSTQRLAEAEGMVIREGDFVDRGTELRPEIWEQIRSQVSRSKGRFVLIEAARDDVDAEGEPIPKEQIVQLNQQRQQLVSNRFSADENVVVGMRELNGEWYRRLMLVVWGIVFAPLGFFLLMQLLLPLAHCRDDSTA